MTGDGIRPHDTITTVIRVLQESGRLPSNVNYLDREPDVTGVDAGTKLPIISVQPVSNVQITEFNTDRDGYLYDENENQVGKAFTAEYRLDLQLDIWAAAGSSTDVNALGATVWDILYEYDSSGPNVAFEDENHNDIQSIWKFKVREGEPANDYTMTPSLTRWRQDLSVWAYNRFDTTEQYVALVDYPSDLSDEDGDGMQTG